MENLIALIMIGSNVTIIASSKEETTKELREETISCTKVMIVACPKVNLH